MLLGLPPLGGFAGRVLVLQAAAGLGLGWPWVAGLVAGLALLVAAVLRALAPLSIAPPPAAPVAGAAPARRGCGWASWPAGCLALGPLPRAADRVARPGRRACLSDLP